MGEVVAIHQPNFFPWLGYFDKIARSDIFVFLDEVQFPKKGGSWSNRVKLLISGEAKWVTAPIERNYSGFCNINEMYFKEDNWREKFLNTLKTNYSKNPFYDEAMEVIELLIKNSEKNVAKYNVHAITEIARKLDLDISKIRKSSEFSFQQSSNELLCAVTKGVGGNIYMCGGGADGYQDEKIFKDSGLTLIFQNFVHPIYTQRENENFTQGLSIIDAVMNLGWEEMKNSIEDKSS